MLVWPAELPQYVLGNGFNESLGEGRLRSPMESGPPKVRRRFSAVARPISASFRVTLNQRNRLRRFWQEDTRGGSLPFIIRNVIDDGAELTDEAGNTLVCPDGNSMLLDGNVIPETLGGVITIDAWWLVMFGEQPPTFVTNDRGLSFIVSMPIVVMP